MVSENSLGKWVAVRNGQYLGINDWVDKSDKATICQTESEILSMMRIYWEGSGKKELSGDTHQITEIDIIMSM